MIAWARQFIGRQASEEEETTRVAWLLSIFLQFFLAASVIITLAAGAFYLFRPDPETRFTLLSGTVMTLCFGVLLLLVRRGFLRLVSILFLSFNWLLVTIWIYGTAGISSDSSALAYALLVVLAGLLLGGGAAVAMTTVSTLAVLGAYYAEVSGALVVVDRPTSVADALFVIIPLVLTGVLLRYAMNSISEAIARARRNELAQIEANRELQALRDSLEQRVIDRTYELERRSVQLQAATEVGRAATSILAVEELIWQVVELIQARFTFYHVGLFVLDEAGEWAVYRAGAGTAGRKLWEQRFRLRVGGESMVGWCTAHGQTRIAQDVAEEKVRVQHDLVPETRSEVALPLIARGQVLGSLSVQSERSGTFDDATVAVLQTMADQVAVALDNARLFTESQHALETTRRAYGQLSHEAWIELLRSRTDWGYSFTHQAVTPAQGNWQPEMLEALRTRRAVVHGPTPLEAKSPTHLEEGDGSGGPALAVPLKVRDDVIGVLGFYKDSADEAWTLEEAQVLQRLVDQLGATLESAQLFRETQQRAAREQAIRQVTEQMRRAVDIEMILQSTVVELANALGAPRAYVRLGTEAELLGTQESRSGDGQRPLAEPEEEPAGRPMEVVSLGGDGKND